MPPGSSLEQRALATKHARGSGSEDTPHRGHLGSFEGLAEPGLRLVLAAEAVPAGRYARQSLALASAHGAFGADFAERVLANVRSNEANVRAALAKVELGEADAAIVYRSDLATATSKNVRTVALPERFQVAAEYRDRAPLRQPRQRARSSPSRHRPEGAATLARHGFAAAVVTP